MDRRSLIAGALAAALSGTALRATEVKLPALTAESPPTSSHVAERRYLKGLWENLRTFKIARNFKTSNEDVRRVVLGYIEAIGKEMPVSFVGYADDVPTGATLIEVKLLRFRESRGRSGCTDYYLDIEIPDSKQPGKTRIHQHLLNIECPRA